ncbi:MAG TPA: amidase [Acidimicrobiales bacterium]|nr:amidase [Acidimicrobiales bacterium]
MTDQPWMEDACSLVDAFRAGTISPTEVLEGSLAAIAASKLNAVCFVDEQQARATAAAADVSLPFGGLPIGVKELDPVKGWPQTEASLVLQHQIADYDGTMTARLKGAGAVLVGQTTASEFGGINCTYTKLHGATSNPYDLERTPGGSSGGSAASVAGGLLPICTGGDGGGSIRIPAGFTGLFGLKATFGRIPKGPHTEIEPLTAVVGCLARSVRDAARWFDVCNGASEYDPFSLPRVEGWEAGLGSHDLRGKKVVVSIDLGAAIVSAAVRENVEAAAAALIADAGLVRVDVPFSFPRGGLEWALAGTASLLVGLGDLYPACESDLTPEIMLAANIATKHYDLETAKKIEAFRREIIVANARVFDEADFIICATNPDVAFPAKGPMPTTVDGVDLISEYGFEAAVGNNGALTIPSNTTGNPAVAIPAGLVDGLPVSMQIIGRHHAEPLLLELARVVERERPWPLVAPGSPI